MIIIYLMVEVVHNYFEDIYIDMTLLNSTAKQAGIVEYYIPISNSVTTESSSVWTRIGSIHFVPTKFWSRFVGKLEVVMSTSNVSVNAQARLYNVTSNNIVNSVTITTNSITSVAVLSSALSDLNTNGDCIYELQIATATSTKPMTCSMGRLVFT